MYDDLIELLESRAASYHFLSVVYGSEPSGDLLLRLNEQLRDHPLSEEEAGGYLMVAQFLDSRGVENLETLKNELAADYAGLFLAATSTPVPPYESVYTSNQRLIMQEARDQVLAEYRREGLDRETAFKEPEDHIAIEMAFMGHLCQSTLEAIKNGEPQMAIAYLEKQRHFLQQHLLNWVPRFCQDVQRAARTDFYRGIARITEEQLAYEQEAIDELLAGLR